MCLTDADSTRIPLSGHLQPAIAIRRHGHIHHLRIGQIEIIHDVRVLVRGGYLQARLVRLLFPDRADRVALIVVAGIDERVVGQLQKLVEQRVISVPWIAVLEVRPARAADEQSVAGEHAVCHHEALRASVSARV